MNVQRLLGEGDMSQLLSGIVGIINDLNNFLSYMRYDDSADNKRRYVFDAQVDPPGAEDRRIDRTHVVAGADEVVEHEAVLMFGRAGAVLAWVGWGSSCRGDGHERVGVGPGALEDLQQQVGRLGTRGAVLPVDDEERDAAYTQGAALLEIETYGIRILVGGEQLINL